MTRVRLVAMLPVVGLIGSCSASGNADPRIPGSASASPAQNLVSYYDVTGTTAAEIQAALLRNSPTIDQVPVFAMTEWEVSWKLRTPQPTRARDCRLEPPRVQLTIRTVLPRWNSVDEAPAELRSQWRSFVVALGAHEAGHRDLGLRAVAAVTDALREARHVRAPTCSQLVAYADAAGQAVLAQFYKENARYDETTGHGATQGVMWPPPVQSRGTAGPDGKE